MITKLFVYLAVGIYSNNAVVIGVSSTESKCVEAVKELPKTYNGYILNETLCLKREVDEI